MKCSSNQPQPLGEIKKGEITKLGEKFYTEELKEKLERGNMGQYVVIDVEQKKYQVDADRLIAVEKAQKDFGYNKVFYIIQIGGVQIFHIAVY